MFRVNKTLQIPVDPIFKTRIYETVLNKTEDYLKTTLRANSIRLFSVNYREVRSTDRRYRRFFVISASNDRDK